jgi:CBS domain containing-hemolysin-like protein
MVADRVTAGDWRFEIVEMDGRRVDRVLVAPVKMQSRLG